MKAKASKELADWLAQPCDAASTAVGTVRSDLPVLVVGAGPAGLAGMAALRQAGVPFAGVEGHAHLGGIWDQSNPVSSVYEGLRTVTSRFTTHLDKPMPGDLPNYPEHSQVHAYLTEFADSEKLTPHIRFSTHFETASKTDSGAWLATFNSPDRTETRQQEYRAIVVATGSHNRRHRVFPELLRKQALAAGIPAIHSSEYRDPSRYAGKRVLVIGVGNSGSDIAEKISGTAQRMLLAIRTSPWIIPQTVGGIPCDHLGAQSRGVPDWIGLTYFHAMRRMAIGSFRSLGLTRPRYRLNDRLPISDRGVVRAIREGSVIPRSQVTDLEGGVARFADSSHSPEPVDAVIFATGFARKYPMLPELDAAGARLDDALLFCIFHRREPGLAFLTETVGLRSCWPIFVEQARAIAGYFLAEQRGSPQVQAFDRRRGLATPNFKGKLFCLADDYHLDYEIYVRALRGLTEWMKG